MRSSRFSQKPTSRHGQQGETTQTADFRCFTFTPLNLSGRLTEAAKQASRRRKRVASPRLKGCKPLSALAWTRIFPFEARIGDRNAIFHVTESHRCPVVLAVERDPAIKRPPVGRPGAFDKDHRDRAIFGAFAVFHRDADDIGIGCGDKTSLTRQITPGVDQCG